MSMQELKVMLGATRGPASRSPSYREQKGLTEEEVGSVASVCLFPGMPGSHEDPRRGRRAEMGNPRMA